MRASEPFHFYSQVHLPQLTGLKARNLKDLLYHVRNVPGAVIYHHTHHFLQQHQFLSPEPPNDFAYWVAEALNEVKLGEQLASINTIEFSSLRALREKIAETIERYLNNAKGPLKEANEGHELYFIKSLSFIFPTPYEVWTLPEFLEALRKVTISSLYFHMFEARLRNEKSSNDFSLWLESGLGENELARKIARLDPYTHTIEGLRNRIIRLAEERISRQSLTPSRSTVTAGEAAAVQTPKGEEI